MKRILPISRLGKPVLRGKAKPVPQRGDPRLARLVTDMIATMHHARGVGIAAPQVGVPLRVFVVAPRPSVRYPHAPFMKPLAMINPCLISHSKSMKTDWEGCLSIPG